MQKNWFEVDKKGLQALQAGKSKTFIIRELVQNAFDEDIKECIVKIEFMQSIAAITVLDDSPEGFRDLAHAYTLYADTYKRKDPEKRGRFNLGEKEVLSVCEYAEIRTTKGTIIFSKDGRKESTSKRPSGSEVYLNLKLKDSECHKLVEYAMDILPPKGVKYMVNNCPVKYRDPYKVTEETLKTEIQEGDAFRSTKRKTEIHVHRVDSYGDAYLYEMGIPVCVIDCDYSLDVQQKVPLSTDRTKVSGAYLKELYAAVLNVTFDDVTEETSSNNWIRTATTSENINEAAVETVIEKRYGDKVVVANENDPVSIDRAISNGYRVIRGGEMSGDEWNNVKKFDKMESSTNKFGSMGGVPAEPYEPKGHHKQWHTLIHRIASLMDLDIDIEYVNSMKLSNSAEYGSRTLTFNVCKIPRHYWNPLNNMIKVELLDLIIHEICHEKGMHYESSYHKAITRLGATLALKMVEDPEFLNVEFY